ncbi:hypothetical protein CesoFtcFv8_022453 [Champsocephalus esox]|uniref:Otopetrin-3 n=1 Tax=Champsocephalus esox TaxID=159716 RepID=A0AAN8BBI2_9TELE|nr:hypothetical protein CesoFtcFv8_022453 [Champsocephalus esox]
MNDNGLTELDSSWGKAGHLQNDEPVKNSELQIQEPEQDPVLAWVPSGRRLISGLLGLNVMLLGAALVAGQAFNPEGLKHQEPQVFMLLLMGASILWMLWYLLWASKQPGICPHKDHHAGGNHLVLMLFAAFSLLLYIFRVGYLISMRECKPAAKVLSPFIEAPFLALQTYLLWAHSKDCIHRHKIITRSGLMVILSADLVLWLNAVTEDTIHEEIELEKEDRLDFSNINSSEADSSDLAGLANSTWCQCSASAGCLIFRKGFEILYPFNMEFYLMAGCLIYVMWKNVGRRLTLSYFSLVAALAVGTHRPLGDLDLSYSLLSLLELILQNIFIIEGLHRHPNLFAKRKEKQRSSIFKKKVTAQTPEERKTDVSLLERNTSAAAEEHAGKKTWTKRAIREICAFLILSNVMLWVIPAFGVHPQFENGLGKQFFGFSVWFALVNLGQPLSVFYRMHSVGALMELLISA